MIKLQGSFFSCLVLTHVPVATLIAARHSKSSNMDSPADGKVKWGLEDSNSGGNAEQHTPSPVGRTPSASDSHSGCGQQLFVPTSVQATLRPLCAIEENEVLFKYEISSLDSRCVSSLCVNHFSSSFFACST